jgi:hypothetical protein
MAATLPRDRFQDQPYTNAALAGSRLVRHLVCMTLVLSLSGCGGGKSPGSLSITCAGGTQLVGAVSIEVLGDLSDGRPKIEFPEPRQDWRDYGAAPRSLQDQSGLKSADTLIGQ